MQGEIFAHGLGTSESVGSACSGNCAHGQVSIEEADGRSSRQEGADLAPPVPGSVYGLDVEEELSTMATQAWAEGVCIGKRRTESKSAWRQQIFEVQTLRQVRGLAGAAMCETRDLGVKWLQWHTLSSEGQVQVDMIYVCP